MKKILLFTVLCLIGSLVIIKAETTDISDLNYVLYVEPREVPKGATEITLSVRMKNEREADGFSFGVRLPEGFSVATDNDGNPDVKLSTERTNSNHIDMFQAVFQDENKRDIKVSASKYDGDGIIEGNEGEVALTRILLPADATGLFSVTIYEPTVSVKGWRSQIEIDEVETTFEITTGIEGVQKMQSLGQNATYNLHGQRLGNAVRGINVVHHNDGTAQKVLIK